MHQFPHRQSSSNTPLLIATVGLGALLAYALASPRRRAAISAAGHSALDAGARLASSSAERLQEWMPERLQERVERFTARAPQVAEDVSASTADRWHSAVDAAGELMHRAVARARGLPAEAEAHAREALHGIRQSAAGSADGRLYRPSTIGPIIAAAAVGAGLYAMHRYGGTERVKQALGVGEHGDIVLEQTLFIDAPIDQVFDTWSNYENFPRFMSNVESVRSLGGDRSHWKIRGPAGTSVEFDSIADQHRPHEISWHSEAGSRVQNSGRVTLQPQGNGTGVQVQLTYRPPAGQVGQAVSSWLGADPKQEFEEDLQRMKAYIEGRRTESAPSSTASAVGASGLRP